MWKRLGLSFVPLLVLAGAACTSDVDTPTDDSVVEGAVGAGSSCEDLDAGFAAWAEAGFSGSIAVDQPDEDPCLLAYGDVEPETVFAIGSITKAVTAVSILQLVDDGQLSLDDRVGDLVPGLGGPVADATVEQLLLHTSGLTGSIGDDLDPLSKEQAITNLSALELSFEPGSDYEYSNAGYSLLGIVVEEVSGESYRERTLAALPDGAGFWEGEPAAEGPRAVGTLEDGSTGSDGSNPGPHWAVDGNGSVAMTVPQLAEWTRSLFEGDVLSPESTELVATPGFDHGDGTAETPGWVAFDEDSPFGEPFLGTAGGGGDVGQDAITVWVPEQELVVSMASNQLEITSEQLLERVGAALLAGEPLPQPVASGGDVEEGDLAALAGTYQLESGGRFDVAVDGDRLVVAARGPDAVDALFPLPDDLSAEDVEQHEADVVALLEGETQAGRDELEALEGDLGTIGGVEVLGTVDEGELRTYVSLDAEQGTTLAWYALNDQGGIEAVELTEDPPTQLLVPTEDGTFRIDDPTGSEPDLVVTFAEGTMTIEPDDGDVVVAGSGLSDAEAAPMRILLVEDDGDLAEVVALGLRNESYAVDVASTCADAEDLLRTTDFDLACFDLGLPDGDGLDLVRRLGTDPDLHRPQRTLVVTARDAVEDRVAGLDAGADDYLVKPFAFAELVARVRALARREHETDATIVVGDVSLDQAAHRASRAGRDLQLTSRELALLRHFLRHPGVVLSSEDLLEHVWDAHADPFTSSVRVILSRLRKKLGDPPIIETVTGAGYRLVAEGAS